MKWFVLQGKPIINQNIHTHKYKTHSYIIYKDINKKQLYEFWFCRFSFSSCQLFFFLKEQRTKLYCFRPHSNYRLNKWKIKPKPILFYGFFHSHILTKRKKIHSHTQTHLLNHSIIHSQTQHLMGFGKWLMANRTTGTHRQNGSLYLHNVREDVKCLVEQISQWGAIIIHRFYVKSFIFKNILCAIRDIYILNGLRVTDPESKRKEKHKKCYDR